MLAKTLAVSFALAAVLAQLVLADYDINCDEYRKYLENETNGTPIDVDIPLTDEAKNIKAVRYRGCLIYIELAASLEFKCKFSLDYQNFAAQISKYLARCTAPNYWEANLKEPATHLSKLNYYFSDPVISKYRLKLRKKIPKDAISKLWMRDIDTFKVMLNDVSAEFSQNYDEHWEEIITLCQAYVDYYNNPIEYFGRALLVVHDGIRYLEIIQSETEIIFLKYEMCKVLITLTPE